MFLPKNVKDGFIYLVSGVSCMKYTLPLTLHGLPHGRKTFVPENKALIVPRP